MERDDKIAFIRQYLAKKSVNKSIVVPEEEILGAYEPLFTGIDVVTEEAAALFAPPKTQEEQFALLEKIFNHSTKFGAKGSPPALTSLNEEKFEFAVNFWKRDHELLQLPGSDFYNRTTATVTDDELAGWVVEGRNKLRPIVESFLPELDITSTRAVEAKIKELEAQIKVARDEPTKTLLEKHKTILSDLNKVNQLSLMSIPQEGGGPLQYCNLAESAGGVTEKVSLITRARVAQQLPLLIGNDGLSFDNYMERRDGFKLSTQAIIKLPKHGDILEVQREAMALNISRMLELDTTRSTMLTHGGRPALFVPFDDIRLLKEFATGKTLKAFGGGEYSHYSTINPVGQGLHHDEFVDDFGSALGIFFVCSDTDAMGGYNQNKALRGNSLFMFDQVLMNSDKLGLDSRLSMQPIKFITKHSRHDQGRNRTLIEDSSIEDKFDSLIQLKGKQVLMGQYFDRVAYGYEERSKALTIEMNGTRDVVRKRDLKAQIKTLDALSSDARQLAVKVEGRIKEIDKILPKNPSNLEQDLVKKAVVLEKLVNNPVLYSDDGRPYRNPWTDRHNIHVKSIEPEGRDGVVKIKFDKEVPREVLLMIRRANGQDSPKHTGKGEITIRVDHLRALTEDMCFPEHSSTYKPGTDYLDVRDLGQIQQGYGQGHRGRILETIRQYQVAMAGDNLPEKLDAMKNAEQQLHGFIETAGDQGFGMHVFKKLQFDLHQKMLALIPIEDRPHNLTQAFNAAVKLDQMSRFNQVVREAIQHDKLNDPDFLAFLQSCIDRAGQANDHMGAKRLSEALVEDADRALISIKLMEVELPDLDEDLLAEVDPLLQRVDELHVEHGLLEEGVLALQQNRPLTTPTQDDDLTPPTIIVT